MKLLALAILATIAWKLLRQHSTPELEEPFEILHDPYLESVWSA